MRIALVAVIALAFYSYSSSCIAQNDGFQGVSGDFARNWLNNFLIENPKPTENEEGSLWSWGSAPRGSMIVDGRLVSTPNQTILTGVADLTDPKGNWLGEIYVDPYSGLPSYGNRSPFYEGNAYPAYNLQANYSLILPPIFNIVDPWT
ncbi:MAG: hypothetical protein LUQ38_05440 [Methanotrichaceae archaeon]|nr:hypothetical protein [Methanotrichaceae archaeon]